MSRLEEIEKRLEAIREFMQESPDWPNWTPADMASTEALLAVAKAAAALPWLKRGLYIEIPEIAGLSGTSKDARLQRLHAALAPLLEKGEGDG